MHAVIVCAGSAGDVFPGIALGQVLDRRGHEVLIIGPGQYRQQARDAGLSFLAVGSAAQVQEVAQDKRLWGGAPAEDSVRALWRHLGRLHEPTFSLLEKYVRPGETVLVGGTLALAARVAQERLQVPMASLHLWPPAMMSAHEPAFDPAKPWLRRLPRWMIRRVYDWEERRTLDPAILPELNALRRRLGLAPVRSAWRRWMHSPQRVIFAFPEWFCAPQPDWPANSVCATFPRLDAPPGSQLPPTLAAFLDGGPPPLAFTPGSAMGVGRAYFERAIAASQALGRRAVLVTRFADQLPASLPPTVLHVSAVPYDLLAPRVAAFAHHGGIGTAAQVLAAGRPQFLTPFGLDQHDNAARLVRLGLAASAAPDADLSVWIARLGALLEDPVVATTCSRFAMRLAREAPAADQIADWVEHLAESRGETAAPVYLPPRVRRPALA